MDMILNISKPTNLNTFHKIKKKLMYKRSFNFPDNHNILNENQFGFHSGHSTTQATMLITDKNYNEPSKQNYYTLVVYFWTVQKIIIFF